MGHLHRQNLIVFRILDSGINLGLWLGQGMWFQRISLEPSANRPEKPQANNGLTVGDETWTAILRKSGSRR